MRATYRTESVVYQRSPQSLKLDAKGGKGVSFPARGFYEGPPELHQAKSNPDQASMAVYPSGGVMPSSWQMSALYILVVSGAYLISMVAGSAPLTRML